MSLLCLTPSSSFSVRLEWNLNSPPEMWLQPISPSLPFFHFHVNNFSWTDKDAYSGPLHILFPLPGTPSSHRSLSPGSVLIFPQVSVYTSPPFRSSGHQSSPLCPKLGESGWAAPQISILEKQDWIPGRSLPGWFLPSANVRKGHWRAVAVSSTEWVPSGVASSTPNTRQGDPWHCNTFSIVRSPWF